VNVHKLTKYSVHFDQGADKETGQWSGPDKVHIMDLTIEYYNNRQEKYHVLVQRLIKETTELS
jgi:hypothetical protein